MQYDINKLCNMKFLIKPKKFNRLKKYNVVSTSLFRMSNGYKNFEKYMKGLKMGIEYFTKNIPDMKYLLFIDSTISADEKLMSRIKSMNNGKLICIEFTCPDYIAQSLCGHVELFGSMIRFLPFFNYIGNFTKNVICVDADLNQLDASLLLTNYNIFNRSKVKYQYDTNMFYEIIAKWCLMDDLTILAGRHMCKYKFPIHMFADYIECMKNGTCPNMATIRSYMDYVKYEVYPYGIDEYFLNYIMLPYIKKKNILYSVSSRYVITAPLYYLNKKNTIPAESEEGQILSEALRNMLHVDKSVEYHKLFELFDNALYSDGKPTNRTKKIAYAYYKFIKSMWDKEYYNIFCKQTLKTILENKKYIYRHVLHTYKKTDKVGTLVFPGSIKLH